MRRRSWCVVSGTMVAMAVGILIWQGSHPDAMAQTGAAAKSKTKIGTSKTKSANDTKELDVRAEKNLDAFIAETMKIADDFERAGRFEEAQEQLKNIGKLKPELPGLKEKLDKVTEGLFLNNELEVLQDAKDSWKAHVLVSRGKPVRVDAIGEYTVVMTLKSDASGFSTKDPKTDMVADIRCGALMGIIVPVPDQAGNKSTVRSDRDRNDRDRDRANEPFEIGSGKEFTPKEDGVLLLNLNLPSGHKSTGKLNVRISGHIKMLPKELR